MPFKREKYPSNWEEFSRFIRFERAKNRCEKCNVLNYAVGFRVGQSFEYYGGNVYLDNASRGYEGLAESRSLYNHLLEYEGEFETRPTLIVLTAAHLDQIGDICDCEEKTGKKCAVESHVLAMCQSCHLNYDRERHNFNRRRNRAEQIGQLWLGDWDQRFETKK